MKAIFIDVENKEVRYVELATGLPAIYEQLKCDCFTTACRRKNNDALYVDDEGLLKTPIGAFQFKEYHQVLSGNGLLIGTKYDGYSQDCLSTLDEIKELVSFVDIETLPQPGFEIITF